MQRRPRPKLLLVSAEGTLGDVARRLRIGGASVSAICAIRRVPVPPSKWLPRLRAGAAIRSVLVASPYAVEAGVLPWREAISPTSAVRYWAVGPTTKERLRAAGVRRVRRGSSLGVEGLVRRLRPADGPLLRFRSDRAGPGLARTLRDCGIRVRDVVVYRTVPNVPLGPRGRAAARSATFVLFTSPSAIAGLRRLLSRAEFGRLRRTTSAVGLGHATSAAARRSGFRRVLTAPTVDREALTRYLLDALSHAHRTTGRRAAAAPAERGRPASKTPANRRAARVGR